MRVSVIQSNYIPWKGYFDIIANSDIMVFYDDVQFTKNDWRNRNRIKTSQGLSWLSVPVGSNIDRKINEVAIVDSFWQKKHLRAISTNYSGLSGVSVFTPFLEEFYLDRTWKNLSEMNQYFIVEVSRRFLGVDTDFRRVEDYHITGDRQGRLMNLLEQLGATSYLTGPSALAYLDRSEFVRRGITLEVKKYDSYPMYRQKFGDFEHAVSIVDLIMSCGSASREYFFQENSFYSV